MAFPIVSGAAIFSLWATARPGIAHEALTDAVLGEVDLLTDEGPADVELERVRNLHAAGIESGQERISERADRLSMYACLFDQPERANSEVARYEAVDADRVRSAMAASLRADNRVLLTYLPADSDQPGTEEAA